MRLWFSDTTKNKFNLYSTRKCKDCCRAEYLAGISVGWSNEVYDKRWKHIKYLKADDSGIIGR